MDPFTLGEYALKAALKVGLQLKKYYTSEADNGIDQAFQFALDDWSQHPPTSSDRLRLNNALERYIQNATSYERLDADTRAFIDCFKKRLSEQPAAHNYLMTLRADEQAKNEKQNLLEHHRTQESMQGLMNRMEELNMAPQYIRALLKELPIEQGLERTELALGAMLANGRIHSEGTKCLVAEFVRFLFEHTDKIAEEARRLREAGDSYLAETLEEIKRVLTGESEQSLTTVYEGFKTREKQKEVRVLQELIEAAQIQFSFGEARGFYERLIELAPTIEHHFKYAYLLQSLNDFEKAINLYEMVLKELRELAKQNSEAYKPHMALTLNNLGSLLRVANDFKQAQSHFEEALEIYRKLTKLNPEAYNPYVAMSLNNLGCLLRVTNDFKQAQAHFEEALEIRRELAKQNPEVYKPHMATTLNNLGNLLRDTNDLKQAQAHYEEALKLYQDLAKQNPEAYKPDVAMTLNNLGALLYATNGLKQAQDYYEEALETHRELAEQNPEAYKPDVAATLNNLGSLLYATNDLKQTQDYYEEALEIRRELAKKNPKAYNSYVAMTLNNLVILYLELKKKGDAEKAYQGAHDIYQKLAGRHPGAYEIDYAGQLAKR
jgi:tetratricopeptide repeat protein